MNSSLETMCKVFVQQDCNYRHLQDAVAMLPAATRELDPNARPDTLRALNAMTAAVTGANPQLFLAVAEVDGVTAGFLMGAVAGFLLESRTLAQDILLYVAPEHRGAGVASALIQSFVEWAKTQHASEIRFLLMKADSAAALSASMTKLQFAASGTVMSLKP